MRTRQVLMVVGMLALATLSAQAQWLDGWSFRRTLTVDANQIDDDLSDFPLLVRLTPGVVDFGLARADGFDIRFTAADGMSPLVFERERHDAASGTGIYWVRLPLVSSTTDTTFFVYYGNSAAPDGANPSGVWDSDHVAVWHLAQTNGVTQADSTVHANHLTLYGDVAEGEPGITGVGIGLSGSVASPEYLATPAGSFPTIDTTAGLTYSAWAYSTNTSTGIILDCGGGNWSPYWLTYLAYNNASKLCGYSSSSVNHGNYGKTAPGFTVGTWKHVTMTVFYDGGTNESTLRLYINGALVLTNSVTGQSLRNPFTARPLVVSGRTHNPWPKTQPVEFFNGWLDEIRVSKVQRSGAWIGASYRSQQPDSTLLSLGPVETTVTWYPKWKRRRLITVKSAQIDADLSDFPLLVRLTPKVLDFDLARADGFDIRFAAADGVSPLDYEREQHDAASGIGLYWVRLPLMSSTTDTTFYLYYGNSAAPDGADPSRVWDNHHVAVWHLAQTNGVTQADSTAHANHLTLYGDVAEGEPGITGGGIGLSGSAENPEYLANPPGSFPIIDTTAGLTYSAWAHPTDPPDSWATILNCGGANWPPWWATWFGYSKTSQLRGYSSASVNHGGWGQVVSGFTVDTWKHVVMSVFYDADASKSTLRLYINGAQVLSHTVAGTNDVTAQSLHNPFAGRPLVVGARTQSTWPANDPGSFFNGWLDEVRVCKVRRSEAWISASYQNQQPDSTLLSFGGIEPATGTMVILR